MSPAHILVPAVVRIMPGLNQIENPNRNTIYTLPFNSHSVLCPRSPQPLSSPASVSFTPVSLSHAATACTLTLHSRPHAPPSLLSTSTMKSYWAINHYSVGRNHAVSNPSSSHTRRRPPVCSRIHHVLMLAPYPYSPSCSPSSLTVVPIVSLTFIVSLGPQ